MAEVPNDICGYIGNISDVLARRIAARKIHAEALGYLSRRTLSGHPQEFVRYDYHRYRKRVLAMGGECRPLPDKLVTHGPFARRVQLAAWETIARV